MGDSAISSRRGRYKDENTALGFRSSDMKIARPFFSAGFSLIELIVVVGVFGLISAVVLANYPGFNHKVSVQNLAHLMALEIRQAQVFGLSVKETTAGSGSFPGYGAYFTSADLFSFILYTDLDNNRKYNGTLDCSSSPECLEKAAIASGDSIRKICAVRSNGQRDCTNPSVGEGPLDYLNISFIRPDPDANILGTYGGGPDVSYQKAEISVEPPKKDFYKTIVVWTTGQISIE